MKCALNIRNKTDARNANDVTNPKPATRPQATDGIRPISAMASTAAPHVRPRAVRALDVSEEETVEFAVEALATAREPVLIVSEDGAGKTTFLLSILCAMAAGEPVFGRFGVTAGPVLLISEEDPATVLRNHAAAIAHGHGWDIERTLGGLYLLALEGVQVEDAYWHEVILDEVRRIGAVAVGLDPYADLTGARENSNDEARPFKALLREIGRLGATPFVCHHAGKAAEGRRKRDRIRGATALPGAARSTLYLEQTAEGIAVEPLKLSRALPHTRFVVSREIEADEKKPGVWRRARFTYASEQQAGERSAEAFVVGLLKEHGSLTSTQLRDHAKGSGFSGQDISEAQKRLSSEGRITFDEGARKAKHWRLSQPEDPGQGGQLTLPTPP